MEQASAAAEARVAIAFVEHAITLISLEQWTDNIVARGSRLWPKGPPEKNAEPVANLAHCPRGARENPQSCFVMGESLREICRMFGSGKGTIWGLAVAAVAGGVLSTAMLLSDHFNSEISPAKDYEECAEEAKAKSSSSTEYNKLSTHCGERFAGRRKPGGGYTYFDFMQNRTFNIAGPNPTENERKEIDRAYIEFLGKKGRELFMSDLTKALADQEQAGFPRRDVGSPLALTPKIPLPAKRPPIERSKGCDDGSFSCSWAKLSAAVRNALASNH